jgi:NADPH2:quinone reductase
MFAACFQSHDIEAETMRAAYYEKNGPAAEVIEVGEIETPVPRPGEVRIRLKTSGINPSDVKSRAGLTRKIAFPRVIPHSDGAGEIDRVGEGVPTSRLGERVWVWNAQWRRAFGTAAEYVVLPQQQAVKLPDNTSFEIGACLGIPAMTAYNAVERTGLAKGMTVLVAGGAAAVGHYAIQFAKERGATVIATISSPEKATVARDAGADHTIDYKCENVGERVKEITANNGVDAVIEIDLAANGHLLPDVLRSKGIVVVYGLGGSREHLPLFYFLQNSIRLQFMLVYDLDADERERAIAGIGSLLAQKRLIHRPGPSFGLDRCAEAHQAMESGTAVGKILLHLD